MRLIVPVKRDIDRSRAIRFRWFQGYLNRTDGHLAPRWAIRNVILSPYCPEMCNGHGRCTKEGTCECDNGYVGHLCDTVSDPNPQDFHESFEGTVSVFQNQSVQLYIYI